MKLFYYRGKKGVTNFGDELNTWLWRRLLPGLLDEDDGTLFVGVGTLLNDRLPRARRTIVFGAGVGYGTGLPETLRGWKIYCLRGPLSARALNVSPSLAVTDPALLVRRLLGPAGAPKSHRLAFMPHWISACELWEDACRVAGLGYIDPRRPVEEVLGAITQTETLITESLHGAIVADALRVPWACVSDASNPSLLPFKWHDWCASVGVRYAPGEISRRPASPRARRLALRGWARRTQPAHGGDDTHAAAAELTRLSLNARPDLSDETRLERLTTELETRLEMLKADTNAERLARAS
jgi:succinoglycan biosynthesis protein ExoV